MDDDSKDDGQKRRLMAARKKNDGNKKQYGWRQSIWTADNKEEHLGKEFKGWRQERKYTTTKRR